MSLPHDLPVDEPKPAFAFSRRFLFDGLLLLPLITVPLAFSTLNTNTIVIKETLMQLFTVLLAVTVPVLWLAERPRPHWKYETGFTWLLVGFGTYLGVSYAGLSPYPRSEHEFLRWLCYLMWLYAVWQYCARPQRAWVFLWGCVTVCLTVCVYGILQAMGIDFFSWDTFGFGLSARRITASMGNPDFLAGYLVGLIPLTLIMLIIRQGGQRWIMGGVLTAQIFALILTYSRGGWVAAFTALLILLSMLTYANWIKDPPLLKPKISLKLAVLSLAGCALLGLLTAYMMREEIAAAMYRFARLSEGESVSNRFYFYRGALAIWLSRPWLGYGIGSFNRMFTEFRDVELSKYLPFKIWNLDHAHNEFLEILAETGLIGLLGYLALIGFVLYQLWVTLLRQRTRDHLILLGLFGGILAIWVHNLFTVTLRHTPSAFLFWGLAGCSLGLLSAYQPKPRKPPSSRFWTVLPLLFVLFAAPYAAYRSATIFYGDYLATRAMKLMSRIDAQEGRQAFQAKAEKALVALHGAKRLAPDVYETYYRLGLLYDWCHDYIQQQRTYEKFTELQSRFTSLDMNLCIAHLKQAEQISILQDQQGQPLFSPLVQAHIREALAWIKQAVKADPYAPEYYHTLGRCYLALEEYEKAQEAFQHVLDYAQYRRPREIHEEVSDAQTKLQQINQILNE